MKFIRLFIIIFGLLTVYTAFSQISHGGKPYLLQPSILRAASNNFFYEMPSINLDSLLKIDTCNEENMRSSYKFAYKFYTDININDGIKTVLSDGTTVRQIGIRSNGAYSINLLLRNFKIPEGGKLFIYSTDYSYMIGSFDHRNNSSDNILPIQPVTGESIIVEYSEPANVPFTGHFTIAEVNHDYRGILRSEPSGDLSSYNCMPDVFCDDVSKENIRSTVLLIINGETLCSGSIVNNTSNDGTPYLLTAVHCLVDNLSSAFPTDMEHYIEKAGTIIAFFNYDRPVCDRNIKMKGTENMSIAGATARVIIPRRDIALLEFFETPPEYYNVYYAGWNFGLNSNSSIYTNIHHPRGAVKKFGMTEESIKITSLARYNRLFDPDSFWEVPKWKTGSTAAGSSGSPLFDEDNLIIGGLTAGESSCTGSSPNYKADHFFVLGNGWETGNRDNQLKTYLDSNNQLKDEKKYRGMDPNLKNPIIRLANAQYTEIDSLLISNLDFPNSGYIFGNNNLQTYEFAEEFTIEDDSEIFGAYLLIPAMNFSNTSDITVSVYSGDSYPEKVIGSASYYPSYKKYFNDSEFPFIPDTMNLNIVPNETFVKFDEPITASKKFFISYSIKKSEDSHFCVYNTKFGDNSSKNTAWVKDEVKGWIQADKYDFYKDKKTSLAIHALIRNKVIDQIETIQTKNNYNFYYNRSEGIIIFAEPLQKQGQLSVYSISGQLLDKIYVHPDQTSYTITTRPKGTIGIIKLSNDDFFYTKKIIY